MNRRKILFIALAIALPLALIIPLGIVRSWQPRVLELPLNSNARSTGQSDMRDFYWRSEGLFLVYALSDAWEETRAINNWNGARLPVRALRAQAASLDRSGDAAALIYAPGATETLDIWDIARDQRRFALSKRIAARLDSHQTFGFAAFEISPNGKRIAWNNYAPAKSGVVGIADARTGSEIARISHRKVRLPQLKSALSKVEERAQIFEASALAWSPDNRQLAVIGINFVRIVDASTGRVVRAWNKPFAIARRAAWSPDSQKLAISRGDSNYWTTHDSSSAPISFLWIHDVSTGKVIRSWSQPFGTPGTGGGVTNLSWAPDGKTLAWGTFDQGAFRMNLASGALEKLQSLPANSLADKSQFVAYAPDGQTLAVATQNRITLWRIK